MLGISSISPYLTWGNAKRLGKLFPYFVTEGSDVMSKSMEATIRGVKDATGKRVGGTGLRGFKGALRTGLHEVEAGHSALVAKYGSFPKYVGKVLRNLPGEMSAAWKAGGEAAAAAGKSSLMGSLKSVGSVGLKRLPLIGSLLYFATEVPNIFRATKDGGLVAGAAETLKAGARIGGFTAGMAIGQALIPIPFVGGLIGGMIGEWLTSKVVGKSYTEQKEEIQQEALAQAAQYQRFDTGATNPFATGMTEQQQLAMLQQMMANDPRFQRTV